MEDSVMFEKSGIAAWPTVNATGQEKVKKRLVIAEINVKCPAATGHFIFDLHQAGCSCGYSRFISLANPGRSFPVTFGCGSPGINNGALPGLVNNPADSPAACAPMVSHTCVATIHHSSGARPILSATMW